MAGFHGVFELRNTGDKLFEANPAIEGGMRVYGGHTLTQALLACFRTLGDDWECYSLHAQFTRVASPDKPLTYAVQPSSDSRNFAVRRITATQSGRSVMTMTASFQKPYNGLDFQSSTAPAAVAPRSLRPETERFAAVAERFHNRGQAIQHLPSGIDGRWTDPQDFDVPTIKSADTTVWLQLTEPLADDPQQRQLALAYCSDYAFFVTALRPHGLDWVNAEKLLFGSLEHSIWFHRPTNLTQWHLCASTCVSTHAGRGFVRGEIFDSVGKVVASLAQEGVLRVV